MLIIAPGEKIDLSSLRTLSSTGSVLNADVCQWIYDTAFPPSVHLVSGSGGTDMACAGKSTLFRISWTRLTEPQSSAVTLLSLYLQAKSKPPPLAWLLMSLTLLHQTRSLSVPPASQASWSAPSPFLANQLCFGVIRRIRSTAHHITISSATARGTREIL
jgi:hypothetical protein